MSFAGCVPDRRPWIVCLVCLVWSGSVSSRLVWSRRPPTKKHAPLGSPSRHGIAQPWPTDLLAAGDVAKSPLCRVFAVPRAQWAWSPPYARNSRLIVPGGPVTWAVRGLAVDREPVERPRGRSAMPSMPCLLHAHPLASLSCIINRATCCSRPNSKAFFSSCKA